MSKLIDTISKAKAGLILDQPFFATLLLSTPIVEDSSVATMATDGESIMFNPEWSSKLSLNEMTFVLAHETLHCVFQHKCRRGEREPNRWNQAADYVINQVLVDEKIGSMPKGGLLDSRLVKDGNGTAEGVYNLLPDSASQNKPGDKGGSLDDCRDAGSNPKLDEDGNPIPGSGSKPDPSQIAAKEAEIRVKVVQARNAAKMQGKLSAGLERLVSELVKTRTDWRTILRRFISERAKTDYSFARPKRRFLADDVNLPSLSGEKIGLVAVAIDCSGSIRESDLDKFSAELNAIAEDTRLAEMKIIYFDAEVLKVESVSEFPHKLSPIGGGGTRFEPIFEEVESWDTLPVCCVVLTDLMGSFGPAPMFPVLWASVNGSDSAPFGEVVEIEDGD